VGSSYAIDGDRLLPLDPLAPPNEIDELAAERETAIVLTCPWHARDAERLGAPLYVPPPDEEAPAFLKPKTLLEPFALRALGFARADDGLLEQAIERFEAIGLEWHAAQTRKLLVPA
jgi:hypothetical protein